MNLNKLELFQNEISCKCMSGGQGHRYQYGIDGKTRSRKQLSWRHGIPIGGCSLPRIVSAVHGAVDAGPKDLPPSYDDIDSQPLNRLVYSLFRKKMVSALNEQDSPLEGYDAIIDLTRRLNALGSPGETQKKTRYILNSLFPSWLPGAFKIMFAKPMPEISCKLNAWATWLTCQWLMGPCTVNDTEIDGGEIGKGHGVLVERCRYLEQAGCASICVNSCKVPTQEFFAKDMGLPLTMTPNYDDFSCQFSFGRTPLPLADDDAAQTPCFQKCPSAKVRTLRNENSQRCHKIDV